MDTENVKIIFVIPSKYESCNETSDLMQQAFDACKQNNIDCKWYSEDECLKLKTLKTDFIVFEEFSGQTFDNVKQFSKSVRILGPWCLLICLTEGKQIPNFSWPIYSVAMMGCTIAFSSLTKQEKKELQEKVESMGGLVSTKLMESCTHLVTNSVKSEKYVKAAESGKIIMLSSWINDVWEASLIANVHGTSEQFHKHVCPVFYNVIVCCTGLSNTQRNELRQLITEHGGVYKNQLHVHKTDILITDSSTQSAKYNAAKKYNIKCVTLKWVVDSIKNGYAMPDEAYHIKIGTSTPTKEGEDLPNFSTISTIGNASAIVARNGMEFLETIDGTQLTILHTPSTNGTSLKRKSNSNENNELVDEINLKEVKSAGSFLDGCGIYLAGFGAEQREKLCKILNFSGATRYNDISERVTHIIGDDHSSELKYLRIQNSLSCPVVSIHWLIASLSEKSPVDEEMYIIGTAPGALNEPGSPLSKKSIHLLQAVTETQRNAPEISVPVPVENQEMDIIQQYLKPSFSENTIAGILNADTFENKLENTKGQEKSSSVSVEPEKDASSAIDDDSSQPMEPIFQGLKFFIEGFTPEEQKQVKIVIEGMSGNVIPKKYKSLCDYAIVPTFSSILNKSATNIVNDLWITECWHENEIRPIDYFHRPFPIDESVKPLTDCVISISTYTNYERNFLKNLIVQLGGVYQDLLSRIDNKNLKACTHLVSPEATGKKYSAAVKWGLPVINKDWLLQCAQTSTYVSETLYLVGDAEPSLRSKSNLNDNNVTDKTVATTDTNIARSTSEEPAIQVAKDVQLNETPPTRTNGGSAEQTPSSRKWPNCGVTASQITPVQQIIAEARRRQLLETPENNLQKPLALDHVDTPETPLELLIKSDYSPNLRKRMFRFLNTFPDHKPRRNSTPLSELKRRLWDKICPQADANTSNPPNFELSNEDENNHPGNDENILTPPRTIVADHIVDNKLKQLQEMLTASGGNRSSGRKSTLLPVEAEVLKDSQPNTVGWDECTQETHERPRRVFMLSGVDQDKRTEMIPQLEKLGANVSNSLNFDPSSTHLICTKPSRNEKILASMSSGKWILHESYVEQCASDGKFVDEELFEFGNPKSIDNIHLQNEKENDSRLTAIHFWRKEIARRGYGAFHDMRFIVVALKRDPLVRVLQAGGGIVIDESPPYTKTIHATHCLLDLKSGTNLEDYIPLAQQGILCINTMYVNDFLLKNGIDVRDYIIPYLLEYHQN